MRDQFYTPSDIARKVLSCVRSQEPKTVADFAAGTGELLTAATGRWPKARCLAIDIDERIVHDLRGKYKSWIVSCGDFLNVNDVKNCRALIYASRGLDLILLNPPFSSRGSSRCEIQFGSSSVACGRALAFVLNALPYLAPEGEMVSILPAGSFKSEKDQKVWKLIRSTFEVTIADTNSHKTFSGCFPHTVIARITRQRSSSPARESTAIKAGNGGGRSVLLYRGRLPMHAVESGRGSDNVPLVHSTCLKDGVADLTRLATSGATFCLKGPLVLFPRVGEPRKDKFVYHAGRDLMALSDCVIALKASRTTTLRQIHSLLTSNWDSVRGLYNGTGAKYITVSEVCLLLRSYGYRALVSKREGWQLKQAIQRTSPELDEALLSDWASFLAKTTANPQLTIVAGLYLNEIPTLKNGEEALARL